MQEYQKGKVLVNSWDNAEPVTIQTHPSLNIVQVNPQYVTNINTEPHNHTTNSVVPQYSWVKQGIRATLKIHDMPIPKQGFLIYDDDKWSFRPGQKTSQKKNSLLPLNDFINVDPNLIKFKQLLQVWISINNIYELQELYAASTQFSRQIILANSADPADISDFAIRNILQEYTLASENNVSTIDIASSTPPK